MYNSRILIVEEAIHIKFDENKLDKDLLNLDESFAYLWLDDSSIATSSSRHDLEIVVPTQQEVQAEVREPTQRIMRSNHLESQIIGDLADHVQIRSSLRTHGNIALIYEMELKHIDDAMKDDN